MASRSWTILSVGAAASAVLLAACGQNNSYAPPPPPKVTVALPVQQPLTRYFEATGNAAAINTANLVARVSGFLQEISYKDGDAVKAGAALFTIEPEPYQLKLEQAQAAEAGAQATLKQTEAEYQRQVDLVARAAASKATLDNALANRDSAAAKLKQAQVDTKQAAINLGYTRVTAPFDGIVTSRNIDIGQLVTVGTTTSTTPLFTVSDRNRLRIYVRVPQAYAGVIKPGMTANFTVPEYPGKTFTAQLAASADAVSTQSGTLLVQFQIGNADGAIRPGDYADVKLPLPTGSGGILMPATALIFRDEGLMVATVGADNHVVMKPITLRQDMGASVMVASGLKLKDRVIDNPPDSLQAGDRVRVTDKNAS